MARFVYLTGVSDDRPLPRALRSVAADFPHRRYMDLGHSRAAIIYALSQHGIT